MGKQSFETTISPYDKSGHAGNDRSERPGYGHAQPDILIRLQLVITNTRSRSLILASRILDLHPKMGSYVIFN